IKCRSGKATLLDIDRNRIRKLMQRADFSCLAERLKSVSVMKFDTMRCWNRDDSVTPEARQNAAHGLDCQSEVIGDVAARHRQIPGKAAAASDLLQDQEDIKAAGTSAG